MFNLQQNKVRSSRDAPWAQGKHHRFSGESPMECDVRTADVALRARHPKVASIGYSEWSVLLRRAARQRAASSPEAGSRDHNQTANDTVDIAFLAWLYALPAC